MITGIFKRRKSPLLNTVLKEAEGRDRHFSPQSKLKSHSLISPKRFSEFCELFFGPFDPLNPLT
jgi:hypothetical protein